VGEFEGQHYFSMDYIEGQSLADKIRENPLPARKAAEYAEQIAQTIQYAHEQGTLHRDLKPSNVLVDIKDQLRITDFGLAKRVSGDSGLTATGQVLGTPGYMPPEQAAGRLDQMGPCSDIYSIGAILYELLTGRAPFRAETPLDTLMQVLDTDPVPPRLLNPRIPRDLETICLKCLQKEPRLRYASAQELADDLRRYLDGIPIQAASLNVLSRVTRALAHSQHEEHFRDWGLALILFGAIIFTAHAAIYVLERLQFGPLVGYWIPRGVMFALILGVLWRSRTQSMLPTNSAERPIWAVWIGYLAAITAVTAMLHLLGHAHWELYAWSAVLSGLCFFIMGSFVWGGSYLIGAVFFLTAPLVAMSREHGSVWFGALWGIGLLTFGIHYWRLGQERNNQGGTLGAKEP
jgi:hypothetical protein